MSATEVSGNTAVRPFQIGVSGVGRLRLRRRINATRWPERETVDDDSQGVPLETMQELARYWGTDYDWSRCEARLNALPQFITEIDGLDIHLIHVQFRANEAYETFRARGVMRNGRRRAGHDPEGLRRPRIPQENNPTHPTPAGEGTAPVGCRATTRRPPPMSGRSCWPPR